MIMDLIQHINEAKSPDADLPSSEEISAAFQTFFNKKAVKESLTGLQKRLSRSATRLLQTTVRLKKSLQFPDTVEQLNALTGKNRLQGFYASKLLNVELLKSAIQQLKDSTTRIQILLSIARVINVVEDLDQPIAASAQAPLSGKHNNIYKYLMKVEAWSPERVAEFNSIQMTLMNKLVQTLADRVMITNQKKPVRRQAMPRPKW